MHFDILVVHNDSIENVYKYGRAYLDNKGIANYDLTIKECRLCHMEATPEMLRKKRVLHYRNEELLGKIWILCFYESVITQPLTQS